MAALIDALREEHRNIGRLLRALERQIDVFDEGGRPDYDVIVGVADYFLDYPDRCHHPKEDRVLRQMLEIEPGIAAQMGDLASAHQALHQKALRFREMLTLLLSDTDVPRTAVVDRSRDFIDAQWEHMRMEEERFLPLAEKLLRATDWAAIERDLSMRSDPVFGGRVEAMFKTLSERLLAWEAEDGREARRRRERRSRPFSPKRPESRR